MRLASRGGHWPLARDGAFAGGWLCVAIAVASPLAARDEQFPVHVVQHILLGVLAPVLLALSGPVTLLLRVSTPAVRRFVTRVLRSRAVGWLSWAPVGAVLSVGAMYPLYLTGIYRFTLRHPLAHAALHAHMLLAGCLFAWALVGVDPVHNRGSWRVRLVALTGALAAHAILALYLYVHAGALAQPGVTGTSGDWRLGAEILWYGGDAADLAVIVAFFGQWYRRGGRELRRQRELQAVGVRGAASTDRPRPYEPQAGAGPLPE
ncbi:cytochrome c oxidase assembly protein [Acidiferrimicrobium sp. IK]|nr:cytochrome c oxidase assembly protein [Acidiferrimicrobium sp. IK]